MSSHKKNLFTISLVGLLAIATVALSSWKSPQIKKTDADTTKNKKSEAHYSKKTIITFDENGNPHEEVIENFEGDEGLKELMLDDMHFDFDFPPFSDFDIAIPEIPHVFIPPLYLDIDTTDFRQFHFDGGNLELFDEELEERLHGKFERMGPEMEARMQEMAKRLQEMDFRFDEQFNHNLDQQMFRMEERLRDLDMNLNDRLKDLNFNLDRLNDLDIHESISSYSEQLKEFEKAAQKELVKDGYLKANEKIESISWSDDEIEFNGKAIKKEHADKYREIKEKYLKPKSNRGSIE